MNDLLHKLIDVISSQVISQTISERNKVVILLPLSYP